MPPLLRPAPVKLTFLVGSVLVMVTPVLSTLVLPAVKLPSLPRLMSLASLTAMLPSVLAMVWMLFSVEVVAPPFRVSMSVGLRLMTVVLLSAVYCCSVF